MVVIIAFIIFSVKEFLSRKSLIRVYKSIKFLNYESEKIFRLFINLENQTTALFLFIIFFAYNKIKYNHIKIIIFLQSSVNVSIKIITILEF